MAETKNKDSNPKPACKGGNYFVSSRHLQWVSEALCEVMDLHATERTLDIACGNGNASLSAARLDRPLSSQPARGY